MEFAAGIVRRELQSKRKKESADKQTQRDCGKMKTGYHILCDCLDRTSIYGMLFLFPDSPFCLQ